MRFTHIKASGLGHRVTVLQTGPQGPMGRPMGAGDGVETRPQLFHPGPHPCPAPPPHLCHLPLYVLSLLLAYSHQGAGGEG